MKANNRILTTSITLVFVGMLAVGCLTTDAQKGTAVGAAGGSLAGLAIGSLTGSAGTGAAIGAVSGAALGYVVGNERDKEQAKRDAERERAALEKSRITNDAKTAYQADQSR